MIDSTRARKLLEASQEGPVNLLKELKKTKGGKKEKEMLPATVGGATGEESICREFRKEYCNLYNSHHDAEEMEKITREVEDDVEDDAVLEVARITQEVVQHALRKVKPGKGDVTGAYTSDTIKNCPPIFSKKMAEMFRSWLIHGTVTPSLLSCAYLPVFKGGLKDPASCSSYRALAGTSVILKLFDYSVLQVWGELLSSDSLQFAYKSNTSCSQASWLVMEVADHYRRNETPCILTLLDCKQGFDRCTFPAIFSKLRKTKLPVIVTRLLMHIYVNQVAWTRWGSENSEQFNMTNSTRQGSVLSPTIWTVYIEELITELRNLEIGCTIGGVYVGVTIFADDVALLAPNRTAMAIMLKVCQQFAQRNNVVFSTDPIPALSKTKCMYMTGKQNTVYPAPLLLNGEQLPWVRHATHLGHELSELCNMELDARMKRARFIENSTAIREAFHFAHPVQILEATTVYAAHLFGSNLWALYGERASMAWRSWDQAVKRAWRVPLSTHRYTVAHLLGAGFLSLRQNLLPLYIGFFQNLLKSACREVQIVANIVSRNVLTCTDRNLRLISEEFNVNPWLASVKEARSRVKLPDIPVEDEWLLPQLEAALEERLEREGEGEEGDEMDFLSYMIDSFASR